MLLIHLCIVSYIVIVANVVKADEVKRYTDAIKNQLKIYESYKYRVDNSDIYADDLEEATLSYGKFDFIVVGAGSAGAVVARRLSDYKFKTLLLEAGDKQNNISDIPGLFNIIQNSDYNWGYKTAPQKYSCQGMVNHQCTCPRGKVMGGSSVLNGVVYARSNKADHDSWSTEFGITGWSWKETLPYYKKLENYGKIGGDPKLHGMNGPIHIDLPTPGSYLNHIYLNANKEFYRITKDYNGEQQLGAGLAQYNKKNGKRVSSNRAYLSDYNKEYLTIETNAYVTKILIDNKVANGVEFVKDNKRYQAKVKKEVVLSGGSINTPQMLMLSGIGPKNELQKHKIPLIQDLPVGRNLIDHIAFSGILFTSNLTLMDKREPIESYVWDYLRETGTLTNTGLQSFAFYSTNNETSPDLHYILFTYDKAIMPNMNDVNYNEESLKYLSVSDEEADRQFLLIIVLLHPKSKGTLTLQSKSPKDFPIIDQNSLSNYEDVERIYKGIDYIKKLEASQAFRSINAKFGKNILPACKDTEYDSKEYWVCHIRHMSHQIFHPMSTCSMGRKGVGVVDSNLKVYGVKGLRIADLSVVPKLHSGHANALAMMIGEKAADIIKNDY